MSTEEMALWVALYEHARQLRGDELKVLAKVAARLAMGRKQYGALDIASDRRDWTKEASEEALDLAVYLSIALVR